MPQEPRLADKAGISLRIGSGVGWVVMVQQPEERLPAPKDAHEPPSEEEALDIVEEASMEPHAPSQLAEGFGLGGPEDVELFSDVGEVFVAGGERGFAMGGEGGGETVGIRQPVFCARLFRM